jgi:AcrR family transcriptional regulator
MSRASLTTLAVLSKTWQTPSMTAPASAQATPLTRRARQRQATIAEIKTLARQQLAEHGPGALSLRAIARQMGTASSALYRYFASQDELISALCVDANTALAERATAARDAQPPDDHAGRWWAICQAFRRWAQEHPADFALIFGTPQPGYQAPEPVTNPAAGRVTAVPRGVYAAAAAAGDADLDRTQVPPDLETTAFLGRLLADAAPDYPPRLAGIVLNAYASVLGYLVAEVFGSLARLVGDPEQLYGAHLRTVMLGMGFDPALVDAASTHHDR